MNTFVIDLDGTLLSDSGKLESDVAAKLIQVQKMGSRIIIASGRTYSEEKEIIEALELEKYNGAAILADGQYIYDYSSGEKFVRERLTVRDIQRIIKEIGVSGHQVKVFSQDRTYLIFHTKFCLKFLKYFIAKWIKRSNIHLIDVKQLEDIVEADKIATDHGENIDHIRNYYEVTYNSDKCRYEIKQKNVNKASSVRQILHDSREDVFVFGNDENDICLFNEFPNSYVMENSRRTVKNFAKHTILKSEGQTVLSEIFRIAGLEGMGIGGS